MRVRGQCRSPQGVLSVSVLPAICLLFLSWSVFGFTNVRAEDLSTAIIQVAKKNLPAVVHINVTERREVTNPYFQFENDPFFQRYFNLPKMPRKFQQEIQGLGSGMIMDSSGHILTNNHVAGGATKMEVVLTDGSKYPARLVGADPKTDLAVIQIDAKSPLPQVSFGDSDKLEVGEWVVAIGAPRGLYSTVTQGIISAKHRTGISEPSNYQDFLQTDAAINPGNSGGPLLNLKGEVIGINAAIATESGGSEGIGFAIPSNMATRVAKELITHGKVERGWLGVSVQDLTPELTKKFQAEGVKGALVADAAKDGPADKAGIRRGDVIIAYNGKDVSDSSQLRNTVADTPVGNEVDVIVLRGGKKESYRVKIENLADSTKTLEATVKNRLGADIRPLNAGEAKKYSLEENQGVAISKLNPRGPLARAGLEVGDLILGIGDQRVDGLDSLLQLISALPPNQRVPLFVLDHRSGNTGTVLVKIP